MTPLHTIVDFLMNRVSRLPVPERANALCSLFAAILPQMDLSDITLVREQVVARFWTMPEIATAALDLVDGHVILRGLLPEITAEASEAGSEGPDEYSL